MEWMVMPLRRFVDFAGRSRRMEFWIWFVLMLAVNIVFLITFFVVVGGTAALMEAGREGAAANPTALIASMGILGLVYFLVELALFLPSLAVTIRRLHDSDKSGWWVMIFWGPYLLSTVASLMQFAARDSVAPALISGIFSLIWLLSCLVMIVLCLLDGTRGPNRYGGDPKGHSHGDVFA